MVILTQFSPRIIVIIDIKGFIRLLQGFLTMHACMCVCFGCSVTNFHLSGKINQLMICFIRPMIAV